MENLMLSSPASINARSRGSVASEPFVLMNVYS
jgi:hypothetical protein